MCGRGLQWALQPLAGVYWPGEGSEGCVSNERSGRGNSVGVILVVCGCLWCGGRELLRPLVGV